MGAIEWAKNHGFFGKSKKSIKWFSIGVSGLYALVTSLGVHIQFEGSLLQGMHFEGNIPPADVFLSGLEHYLASFTSQQSVYMVLKGIKALVVLAKTIPQPQEVSQEPVNPPQTPSRGPFQRLLH